MGLPVKSLVDDHPLVLFGSRSKLVLSINGGAVLIFRNPLVSLYRAPTLNPPRIALALSLYNGMLVKVAV